MSHEQAPRLIRRWRAIITADAGLERLQREAVACSSVGLL